MKTFTCFLKNLQRREEKQICQLGLLQPIEKIRLSLLFVDSVKQVKDHVLLPKPGVVAGGELVERDAGSAHTQAADRKPDALSDKSDRSDLSHKR